MRLETLKEIRRHIHAIDVALERDIEQQEKSPERSREAPLEHEILSNQTPLVGSLVTEERESEK